MFYSLDAEQKELIQRKMPAKVGSTHFWVFVKIRYIRYYFLREHNAHAFIVALKTKIVTKSISTDDFGLRNEK